MMKRVTHCCAVQEQQPIDAKRRKTLVDVSGNSPHAEAESCTATNRSAKVALASNQRNLLSATANTVISFNRQQSAEVAPIFIDLDLPLDSCSVSNTCDTQAPVIAEREPKKTLKFVHYESQSLLHRIEEYRRRRRRLQTALSTASDVVVDLAESLYFPRRVIRQRNCKLRVGLELKSIDLRRQKVSLKPCSTSADLQQLTLHVDMLTPRDAAIWQYNSTFTSEMQSLCTTDWKHIDHLSVLPLFGDKRRSLCNTGLTDVDRGKPVRLCYALLVASGNTDDVCDLQELLQWLKETKQVLLVVMAFHRVALVFPHSELAVKHGFAPQSQDSHGMPYLHCVPLELRAAERITTCWQRITAENVTSETFRSFFVAQRTHMQRSESSVLVQKTVPNLPDCYLRLSELLCDDEDSSTSRIHRSQSSRANALQPVSFERSERNRVLIEQIRDLPSPIAADSAGLEDEDEETSTEKPIALGEIANGNANRGVREHVAQQRKLWNNLEARSFAEIILRRSQLYESVRKLYEEEHKQVHDVTVLKGLDFDTPVAVDDNGNTMPLRSLSPAAALLWLRSVPDARADIVVRLTASMAAQREKQHAAVLNDDELPTSQPSREETAQSESAQVPLKATEKFANATTNGHQNRVETQDKGTGTGQAIESPADPPVVLGDNDDDDVILVSATAPPCVQQMPATLDRLPHCNGCCQLHNNGPQSELHRPSLLCAVPFPPFCMLDPGSEQTFVHSSRNAALPLFYPPYSHNCMLRQLPARANDIRRDQQVAAEQLFWNSTQCNSRLSQLVGPPQLPSVTTPHLAHFPALECSASFSGLRNVDLTCASRFNYCGGFTPVVQSTAVFDSPKTQQTLPNQRYLVQGSSHALHSASQGQQSCGVSETAHTSTPTSLTAAVNNSSSASANGMTNKRQCETSTSIASNCNSNMQSETANYSLPRSSRLSLPDSVAIASTLRPVSSSTRTMQTTCAARKTICTTALSTTSAEKTTEQDIQMLPLACLTRLRNRQISLDSNRNSGDAVELHCSESSAEVQQNNSTKRTRGRPRTRNYQSDSIESSMTSGCTSSSGSTSAICGSESSRELQLSDSTERILRSTSRTRCFQSTSIDSSACTSSPNIPLTCNTMLQRSETPRETVSNTLMAAKRPRGRPRLRPISTNSPNASNTTAVTSGNENLRQATEAAVEQIVAPPTLTSATPPPRAAPSPRNTAAEQPAALPLSAACFLPPSNKRVLMINVPLFTVDKVIETLVISGKSITNERIAEQLDLLFNVRLNETSFVSVAKGMQAAGYVYCSDSQHWKTQTSIIDGQSTGELTPSKEQLTELEMEEFLERIAAENLRENDPADSVAHDLQTHATNNSTVCSSVLPTETCRNTAKRSIASSLRMKAANRVMNRMWQSQEPITTNSVIEELRESDCLMDETEFLDAVSTDWHFDTLTGYWRRK